MSHSDRFLHWNQQIQIIPLAVPPLLRGQISYTREFRCFTREFNDFTREFRYFTREFNDFTREFRCFTRESNDFTREFRCFTREFHN
jgi:hypothetical protein